MTATWRVELHELRIAGGVMLAAGAARALAQSQLGVPCPLRTVTGIPCPLCGMTTSVTAAVSGDVGAAVAANPGGAVAVLVAVVLLVIPRKRSVDLPRWSVPVALLVLWAWQLARFQII